MTYINDFLKNLDNKEIVVSKFLGLEEQVQLNKFKNKCFFPKNCERKRVVISKTNVEDFVIFDYISIIKISYNKKFGEINHKDVLGAIIGLGIKRECIGDIILDDFIYVYVLKEMENFILNNLINIGRVNVNVSIADLNEVENINVNNYIEDTFIVSSYRLDVIISERCCLSREKAKQFIILKNVKINGVINVNPDYIVKFDDLISIHRFGRLIIKEEVKKTKKDKYILKVLRTK